jgi:hypothetical protein
MGFLDDVGGALPIIGGVAGAFAGGPVGAAIGASVGGQLASGQAQIDALRRAGRIEEAARLEALTFQQQVLGETAPFRQAARGALGQLQREVQAPIGESPLFQRGLQAGTRGIQQSLAPFGLQDSSVAGVAQGELVSGLTANEVARRQSILGQIAQGGTTGFGTAVAPLQLGVGLAGRQAQTAANVGALQSAGQQQLFGNLLQLGLLSQLGGFTAPATPTTATTSGLGQLQQGTGFNQFQSPF